MGLFGLFATFSESPSLLSELINVEGMLHQGCDTNGHLTANVTNNNGDRISHKYHGTSAPEMNRWEFGSAILASLFSLGCTTA
jgi:hypothetical protein